MRKILLTFCILILFIISLNAQILPLQNGDFGTGLNCWETLGGVENIDGKAKLTPTFEFEANGGMFVGAKISQFFFCEPVPDGACWIKFDYMYDENAASQAEVWLDHSGTINKFRITPTAGAFKIVQVNAPECSHITITFMLFHDLGLDPIDQATLTIDNLAAKCMEDDWDEDDLEGGGTVPEFEDLYKITSIPPERCVENIPTLSQWSLIILALLMLIIGVVSIKNKSNELQPSYEQ